jgi:hypothetical protein
MDPAALRLPANGPAQRWRRLARWGALLCALALLVPYNGRPMLFDALWYIRGANYDSVMMGYDFEMWLRRVLYCFWPGMFLMGPACAILCGADAGRRAPPRNLHLLVGACAAVPAVLLPCYFAVLQAPGIGRELIVAGVLAGASVYLLFGGACLLLAKDASDSPRALFWIMLLPLLTGALAWVARVVWSIQMCVANSAWGWGWIVAQAELMYYVGFAGALLLVIGWFKWWSAVWQGGASTSEISEIANDAANAVAQPTL